MAKKILFGLGNPGKLYSGSRHNLGYAILRAWLQQASPEEKQKVFVIEPLLSMNQSGEQLLEYSKQKYVEPNDILILHDDMELPLGQIALTLGGSAKGHNGVRSIYQALGAQDFHRLRLGLGRPPAGIDPSNYVLSKFKPEEQPRIEEMAKESYRIIMEFINKLGATEK